MERLVHILILRTPCEFSLSPFQEGTYQVLERPPTSLSDLSFLTPYYIVGSTPLLFSTKPDVRKHGLHLRATLPNSDDVSQCS